MKKKLPTHWLFFAGLYFVLTILDYYDHLTRENTNEFAENALGWGLFTFSSAILMLVAMFVFFAFPNSVAKSVSKNYFLGSFYGVYCCRTRLLCAHKPQRTTYESLVLLRVNVRFWRV